MADMTAEYPFTSSFKDRHGKTRWRFRRGKRSVALPGFPGEAAFEAAYLAAVQGRPKQAAQIIRHPGFVVPRSLRAAWRLLTTKDGDWKALGPNSKIQQSNVAERFLMTRVDPASPMTFGEMPIDTMKRRDVRNILARMSATPHAGRHVLTLLRKLASIALDEEWIDADPTYRIKHRPEMQGWRAWTSDEREKFERHWPIGSTPRLAYALALYTGQRRADVARFRWSDIEKDGFNVVQQKTRRALWIPILPALKEVLDATTERKSVILLTSFGEPFSIKALGMRMQDWTAEAGLPAGATMHGLRKTLGALLTEGGATTRQVMDILGHTNVQHAELYSRAAEQKRLARDGMKAVRKSLGPKVRILKPRG